MIARTQEQILERLPRAGGAGLVPFAQFDLAAYLPFEHVKHLLKPDAKAEDWKVSTEDPLARARYYLAFAWEKANDQRGLSAARSLDHFSAWLWLAGIELPDFSDYDYYGKEWLVTVSTILDFDWRKHDDGTWCASSSFSDSDREETIAKHEAIGHRIRTEFAALLKAPEPEPPAPQPEPAPSTAASALAASIAHLSERPVVDLQAITDKVQAVIDEAVDRARAERLSAKSP